MTFYSHEDENVGAASDISGPEHFSQQPELPTPMWEHAPEHSPRTGQAFKLTRQALGMSAQDIATYLGCGLRTVQRWEKEAAIPGWVETAIRELAFVTDMWVANVRKHEGALVQLHKSGWRVVDSRPLPESWWNAVIGRVLLSVQVIPVMSD